jgi:hypothetical protein
VPWHNVLPQLKPTKQLGPHKQLMTPKKVMLNAVYVIVGHE